MSNGLSFKVTEAHESLGFRETLSLSRAAMFCSVLSERSKEKARSTTPRPFLFSGSMEVIW